MSIGKFIELVFELYFSICEKLEGESINDEWEEMYLQDQKDGIRKVLFSPVEAFEEDE